MAKLTRVSDTLVFVKSSLAGAIARLLESKLGEVVSVLDFGAKGDYDPLTGKGTDDSGAFQAAISAVISNAGSSLLVPAGRHYLIGSSVDLPREGITIDMHGATLYGVAGLPVFRRNYPQLSIPAFKAQYPAVDFENTLWFRTITINGGRIHLTNGSTGIDIRQPWLSVAGSCRKQLIVNDLDVTVRDTSVAFGIHGGWGFDFNSCSVTGDQIDTSAANSGTCLKMRPDGSGNRSSHAQAIHFTNCNIQYTKLFDVDRGTCTNGAEAVYFTCCNCTFVNGGNLDGINLFEFRGGILTLTTGELVVNRASGFIMSDVQLQRYMNPRIGPRYGAVTFIGGGNHIQFNNIRSLNTGQNLQGAAIAIVASNAVTFTSISVTNVIHSGTIADKDDPDRAKQAAVVRCDVTSDSYVVGLSCQNIQAQNVHNIIDFAQSTSGNIRNVRLHDVHAVSFSPDEGTSGVGRRVFGLAGCRGIVAPQMYEKMDVKMRANSLGSKAGGCSYDNLKTAIVGLTNANQASLITINGTNVSNTTGLRVISVDSSGNIVLALYQTADLAAGTPVEAHATITVDTSTIPNPLT